MKRQALTKKSLEELAQVMPVLSEKEQDELVGGTVYFSKSGNEITFLGEINDSKQGMCFVNSPNDYDKALKKSNTWDRDSYLSSHSQSAQKMISGGDLTDNDIPKLVQSLLYGIKGSGATVTFQDSIIRGDKSVGAEYSPATGVSMSISMMKEYISRDNMCDIVNTYEHEDIHRNYQSTLQTSLNNANVNLDNKDLRIIWERVTYSIQQDSQYYNNSSSTYKNHDFTSGFISACSEYDAMLSRQSSENRQKIQSIVDPYIYGYYNK